MDFTSPPIKPENVQYPQYLKTSTHYTEWKIQRYQGRFNFASNVFHHATKMGHV